MRKQTYIRIIVTAIGIALCSFAYSQKSNIEFNKTIHNFGDIMVNSGRQSCNFTFKNISEQPVVIQTVISSCGCAKPEWTKSPIMPGKEGKIDIVFLNDQGPYPFDKSLTVYITGEPKPIILRIKGVAHEKLKSVQELFPENFNGLSFRKSYIDFGNITRDNLFTQDIEVANSSSKKIEVNFSNLTKGLTVKPNPIIILPGKRADISFLLDTYNSQDWGRTFYNNEIIVNEKKVSGKELKIIASIRDNFSSLSKEENDNAPLPMAGSSSFDFGKIKKGNQITINFKIRNLGKRDLLIHKVESEFSNINSKYPTKIAPGATGTIEVTVNTKEESGEKSYILSVISNSPSRPVMNFVITGLVI